MAHPRRCCLPRSHRARRGGPAYLWCTPAPGEPARPVRLTDEGLGPGGTGLELLEWRLEDVAGEGREVGPLPHERTGAWKGTLPANNNGSRVGGHYLFHAVNWRARSLAELGLRVHAPAECEIISGERRSIVPGGVRAQRVGRFHAA